jgi:hypothetical protein
MATITNADTAGVNKTVMVNSAEQGEVTVLESYEQVMAFVEGEDIGQTVTVEGDGPAGGAGEPSETPEAEIPEEQSAQPPPPATSQSSSDVSDMSEEELIKRIREAADELENRKKE